MNREGKKCVIYPRVSTEMQVDGYSLEGQKNCLRRFAEREEMIIVDVYEDAGKSGKSIEGRPAFQKMLSDIQNGLEIEYILVYKLSRFGRNAADILNSLEFVQSYGINLICIEEGIDSSQTSGKLLISVLSAVAEIERENIIEQTMNGRREKARQGGWNGGFAPYGYQLENGEFNYIMRCDDTFVRGMKKYLSGNDCVITYRFKKANVENTFRVVRFDVNGRPEILVTNLYDESFTIDTFKQLYHLRWGIEAKYDDIKNKLELENFSGTTPLAIKQDFYATLFLNNLASLMILENREEIELRNAESDNKYQYKINVNTVISELKENVIMMLITDSKRQKKKLIKEIYQVISHSVVPIRPNRSFPRTKKHHSVKYHQNDRA